MKGNLVSPPSEGGRTKNGTSPPGAAVTPWKPQVWVASVFPSQAGHRPTMPFALPHLKTQGRSIIKGLEAKLGPPDTASERQSALFIVETTPPGCPRGEHSYSEPELGSVLMGAGRTSRG